MTAFVIGSQVLATQLGAGPITVNGKTLHYADGTVVKASDLIVGKVYSVDDNGILQL